MNEERDALSPELSAFLIEFAIALNKHAMYPGDHPSLGPATIRLHERLRPLLAERELRLGIARDQLVIDGVATDPMNPVLAELAGRLHRHHLAGVSLVDGVTVSDLRDLLATLALEADRTGEPLGLAPPERRDAWPSVHLRPQEYDRLELMAEGEASQVDEWSAANELWIALAQAATESDRSERALEADELANAIQQRKRGEAYDKVIVDYMLRLAGELRKRDRREAPELRRRVSSLIATLEPDVLEELLRLAGGAAERRRFLLNAAEGMSIDAVIALVRAAGRSESQAISESLMRLFKKLAAHTEGESEVRRRDADTGLRDQIRELVNDWTLEDPNPTAYGAALSKMASGTPGRGDTSQAARHRPEPTRIVQMAIEVGETGKVLSAAIDRMVAAGDMRSLLDTIAAEDGSDVSQHIWGRLAGREIFERVLNASPLDTTVLDHLLTRMGMAAAEPMLDVLATSEISQTRRILLDRLTRLGAEVGPLAVDRLPGAPWFVQRNLLRLIADIGVWPSGFDPESYLAAADPRVRIEAIRLLLRAPERREQAVTLALKDPDARVIEMGLMAAVESNSAAHVALAATHARGPRHANLTVLAIRALGKMDDPQALEPLLELAAPRRGLFRSRPPAKSAAYLAALRALHRHWKDPRVTKTLNVAARSPDSEIRDAAMGADREDR